MIAQDQEKLLCNICGITVSTEDTKQHIATSSHESRKSTLERKLNEVEEKNYQDDISVIASWEKSSVQHTISRSKQSS
jgi:hypothetical protein